MSMSMTGLRSPTGPLMLHLPYLSCISEAVLKVYTLYSRLFVVCWAITILIIHVFKKRILVIIKN